MVRYPHRTRPNSGPDQIILVLKISTESIWSWCCLHIHAKFWSAAAVDNSGPISVSQRMSQQCLQTVCVVKTCGFILFSFTFGQQNGANRHITNSGSPGKKAPCSNIVCQEALGFLRKKKIITLWKSKVYHFSSNISDHYVFQILIIIQVSSFDQFAPRCGFAIFVATLTFPAKCQTFGLAR